MSPDGTRLVTSSADSTFKLWETDIHELIELVGADQVLFGSDYPHPECIPEPVSYLDELEGLEADVVHKIMGGNASRLMGFAS